jgi:hypothetical protein
VSNKQRKSGGDRKHGRNKEKCKVYRNLRKYERSHIKRISVHLTRHTGDEVAIEALERYKALMRS